MRILHIIVGLNSGGAEATLYRLVSSDRQNRHIIISLMDSGFYGPLLQREGVAIHCLHMQRGKFSFKGFARLVKCVRQVNPELVQTWMYHADILGGLAAWFSGVKKIVWGIRNSDLDHRRSKWTTILLMRCSALLSRVIPQTIICCSERAASLHMSLGYDSTKFCVIANGVDSGLFKPDDEVREAFRAKFGVSPIIPLLGMVARYDPQKDYESLLTCLSILKERGNTFRLVLVGLGNDDKNMRLRDSIEKLALTEYVLLAGFRTDIHRIMTALDVHVLSSSYAEAFPNVVCEAMACGTLCVSTDVGDAGYIIGDTGWVVPPNSPEKLANAIERALCLKSSNPQQWEARKEAARERVKQLFSLKRMCEAYSLAWSGKLHD